MYVIIPTNHETRRLSGAQDVWGAGTVNLLKKEKEKGNENTSVEKHHEICRLPIFPEFLGLVYYFP